MNAPEQLQNVGEIDRKTRRAIVTAELTHAELLARLRYCPKTGAFTWARRVANCLRGGEQAGCIDSYGYRLISIRGVPFKAHKLAWFYMTGEWPREQIDHINGEKDDNRWTNLREAPGSINHENRRAAKRGSKTGYLGVTFERGKYRAAIATNRREVKLGTFKTAEEASAAYLDAKRVMHKGGTL